MPNRSLSFQKTSGTRGGPSRTVWVSHSKHDRRLVIGGWERDVRHGRAGIDWLAEEARITTSTGAHEGVP
jgi:hypothetical protein